MGDISKALAMEETIKFRDKEYKLAPCNFQVQAMWEKYLRDRAWQAMWEQKPRQLTDGTWVGMDPQEYEQQCAALRREIVAGDYGFYSKTSIAAQQGTNSGAIFSPGQRQMVLIRIKLNHPEVTDELVWEMVEERAEEIREKMRAMDEAQNPSAPAKTTETPAPTSEAA